MRPLKDEEEHGLDSIKPLVDEKRFDLIKGLLKEKKIAIEQVKLESSIADGIEYPQITTESSKIDVSEVNDDIKKLAP